MADRPLKACASPGCPNKTTTHLCQDCDRSRRRQYQRDRDPDNEFYRTKRWRKFRAYLKRKYPLCIECLEHGRYTPSKHFDHRKPRRTHPELAFDESNIDPLCASHHNSKSAREGQEQRRQAGGESDFEQV